MNEISNKEKSLQDFQEILNHLLASEVRNIEENGNTCTVISVTYPILQSSLYHIICHKTVKTHIYDILILHSLCVYSHT